MSVILDPVFFNKTKQKKKTPDFGPEIFASNQKVSGHFTNESITTKIPFATTALLPGSHTTPPQSPLCVS